MTTRVCELEVQNASVIMGNKILLDNVSVKVRPGEVVTVLGPNGAGKSTLLKVISGERKPSFGKVLLNGRNNWPLQQQALMLGVLPQSSSLSFPFTVEEVVLLGRIPCSSDHDENQAIAFKALEEVDGLHLVQRQYTTLSGGEKQRVHMARVLAQVWNEPECGKRYLLLDEPTSALDPAHQQLTLKIARKQAIQGTGVLVILHDLNLAARYSDRLVMLQEGRVFAQGEPSEVLTAGIINDVFNINVTVAEHPSHNCPLIISN